MENFGAVLLLGPGQRRASKSTSTHLEVERVAGTRALFSLEEMGLGKHSNQLTTNPACALHCSVLPNISPWHPPQTVAQHGGKSHGLMSMLPGCREGVLGLASETTI